MRQAVPSRRPSTHSHRSHPGPLPLVGAGLGPLHQAHYARHPPVAGHDDPAGHPAALVVVGPGVVAPQRLADPLAVGVAAAALVAADALVVQHGVDVHGALLALQALLRGERQNAPGQVTPLRTVEIPTIGNCFSSKEAGVKGVDSLPFAFTLRKLQSCAATFTQARLGGGAV